MMKKNQLTSAATLRRLLKMKQKETQKLLLEEAKVQAEEVVKGLEESISYGATGKYIRGLDLSTNAIKMLKKAGYKIRKSKASDGSTVIEVTL